VVTPSAFFADNDRLLFGNEL